MDNAEIARNLLQTFQQFRRVMKAPMNFDGLKPNEMGLLFHIKGGCHEMPDGIKVSDLSSKMHVTSPSVTQLVTSLEERGLVERNMDPGDRRSVKVSLTEKGNAMMTLAESHLLMMLTGMVEHLGPEKSRTLTELLKDVYDYVSKLDHKGGN